MIIPKLTLRARILPIVVPKSKVVSTSNGVNWIAYHCLVKIKETVFLKETVF